LIRPEQIAAVSTILISPQFRKTGMMNDKEKPEGMPRREFLGAAAAAAGFGMLDEQPISAAQPKPDPALKGSAKSLYERHAPKLREHTRPLPDTSMFDGMKYQKAEASLPTAYHDKMIKRIKEIGLDPVDAIQDKTEISCFQRDSLPHWSGINTFLKFPTWKMFGRSANTMSRSWVCRSTSAARSARARDSAHRECGASPRSTRSTATNTESI
jgi:hypothetical protein